MIVDKKYIKDTIYINIKGTIDKETIRVLEKELYIIIYKIGILKITININNAYLKEDITSFLRKIKTLLIIKGGTLFLVHDKRLHYAYLTYQNEYQVFKLSTFI